MEDVGVFKTYANKCKNNPFSYTNWLCSHTMTWCISKEGHFFEEKASLLLWDYKNRRTFAMSKDKKSSSIEA